MDSENPLNLIPQIHDQSGRHHLSPLPFPTSCPRVTCELPRVTLTPESRSSAAGKLASSDELPLENNTRARGASCRPENTNSCCLDLSRAFPVLRSPPTLNAVATMRSSWTWLARGARRTLVCPHCRKQLAPGGCLSGPGRG